MSRTAFLSAVLALAALPALAQDDAIDDAAFEVTDAVSACPSAPEDAPISFGDPEPLTIETREGLTHVFSVEIAASPEQQTRGLMHRSELALDAGMLFTSDGIFPAASMIMTNTCLSLDMLFLRGDGEIAAIARQTIPFSNAPVPLPGLVAAVLEINGGQAEKLNITPGDYVRHPAFGVDEAGDADAPTDAG